MDFLTELKLQNTSINECSKKTGIPYGSLYPLLHKSKPLERCEYNTLKKLSDFFHCSIDDLFDAPKNFSVFWEARKTIHKESRKAIVLQNAGFALWAWRNFQMALLGPKKRKHRKILVQVGPYAIQSVQNLQKNSWGNVPRQHLV